MRFHNILILLSFITFLPSAAMAAEPIKIGYVDSFTGLPHYMERARAAAQMAVDEFNTKGGYRGQKIELLLRDDRGDPATAIQVVESLLQQDKTPMIIGASYSHVALAIKDLTNRAGVPYFAMWCTTERCDVANERDLHFIIDEHPFMTAANVGRTAAALGHKRWAFLGSSIEWSQKQYEHIARVMKETDPAIEFVVTDFQPFLKADIPAVIQKLKVNKIDAVLTTHSGSDLSAYIRQGKARGVTDLPHVHVQLMPEELAVLKDETPEGWHVISWPERGSGLPAYDNFIGQFQARFGKTPGGAGILTYINTTMALAALGRSESLKGADIAAAAKNLSIDTPVGPVVMDPATHRANTPYWMGVLRLQDGLPVMTDLKRNTPLAAPNAEKGKTP